MLKCPMEWHLINLAMALLGALLHSFGLCLLFALRNSRMRGTQRCYLTHLSLAQLVFCVDFSVNSVSAIRNNFQVPPNSVRTLIEGISLKVTVWILWYLIMFTFTIDRFFEIKWIFKYRMYWSPRRANLLCVAHWIICFAFGAAAVAVCLKSGITAFQIKFMYIIYLVLYFSFLVTALSTYSFIFAKYKKSLDSHLRGGHTVGNSNAAQSTLSRFKGSKFWIATLIIAAFVIFSVFPDIILAFIILSNLESNTTAVVFSVALTMRLTCFVADACIYILLSPEVKRLIIKKLRAFDRSKGSWFPRRFSSPQRQISNEKEHDSPVQTTTTAI